ncbi:phage antirepressor KilAC domain-containing protein, partial [Bacillus sp. SS-TM]
MGVLQCSIPPNHARIHEALYRYADIAVPGIDQFRYLAAGHRDLLKAKEPEFRLFLMDNHIMYRLGGVLTPYHQHIEAQRFEVKTGTTNASNYAFS